MFKSVQFNQDFGCFAASLDQGFRIYNSDPIKEKMRKDLQEEALDISSVEMLYRTNYLAIVGASCTTKSTSDNQVSSLPPTKLLIWDDRKGKTILELEFRTKILNVKLRRENHPQKLHLFETPLNQAGILSVSTDNSNAVIAFPASDDRGDVQVVDLNDTKKRNIIIPCHNSAISLICLSGSGSLLATASVKGTLIRLFDASNGSMVGEFRRGIERVKIENLVFNNDSSKLLVSSSDKGTIHIFSITDDQNKLSSLHPIKAILPKYFSSKWSAFKIRLPDSFFMYKYKAAFGYDGKSVIAVAYDGTYFKYSFRETESNHCYVLEKSNFLPRNSQ